MAGSRISIVLHDGNRITDRKPLAKAFHDKTVMETTRAIYGPAVETKSYDKLGEEVVAIGGLRKDDKSQAGLQLYLAIEVDGKVVQMGLPFMSGSNGEDFLNPANIKPGDIDSLLRNMPSNTEILLVWRLDRGMTQDIVLSENSIVSSMAPPQPEHGFSLLDQKPCVSCGMGPGSKIDLVADITEVKIFCGDLSNPIRMATMLVPPPESFSLDSWAPQTPVPSPLVQAARPRAEPSQPNSQAPNHLAMQVDFMVRMSWEDSLKASEAAPPLLLQSGLCPEGLLGRQEPSAKEAAPAAFVLAICSSKPCRAEMPAVPAKEPKNRLITLIMNPAEYKLWSDIYKRPSAEAPAQQAHPMPIPAMAFIIPKTAARHQSVPAKQKSAASKPAFEAGGIHALQQETIVKTVPMALPATKTQPSPHKRQKPLVVAQIKKREAPPKTTGPEKQKPVAVSKQKRKPPKPLVAERPAAKKRSATPLHPGQSQQKAPKPPKQSRKPVNAHETKEQAISRKGKPSNARDRTRPEMPASQATRKSEGRPANKKSIKPFFLSQMLGLLPQWKSRGRKFRAKKNRAV